MANELAYGFVDLQHLFSQRLSEVNTGAIDDAVTQSLAEYNRQIDALLGQVVGRTTLTQERFRLPGSGTLQPLDENGVPIPVRVGAYADVGFPIQGGGTAWATNRVSRELMTVAEANEYQVMVQQQDADWVRRHILAALLDNGSWTHGDPLAGDITIYPLANGDTQQYLANGALATDDHYLAQLNTISDADNPFPTIYDELTEHPGNGGPIVAYVANDLRADIEALSTFTAVSDPDITPGSGTDTLTGGNEGIRAFGDEVIGKVDGVWIVSWNVMPSGYMVAIAQGAAAPAIAMREHPTASLQGLFREDSRPDSGREQYSFIRYAGFGARNRTAALVQQIGSGTYATPTGFSTPLAV